MQDLFFIHQQAEMEFKERLLNKLEDLSLALKLTDHIEYFLEDIMSNQNSVINQLKTRGLITIKYEKALQTKQSSIMKEINSDLMIKEDLLSKLHEIQSNLNNKNYEETAKNIKSQESQIKNLIQSVQTEITELNLADLALSNQSLISELTKKKQKITDLHEAISNLNSSITEIKEHSSLLSETEEELIRKTEKLGKDLEASESQNETLRKEIQKLSAEKYISEITVRPSQDTCNICGQEEAGRMKKCIKCPSQAHAKCTKDIKYICNNCKID